MKKMLQKGIYVRVDEDVWNKIKLWCEKNDRPMQYFLEKAIDSFLNR